MVRQPTRHVKKCEIHEFQSVPNMELDGQGHSVRFLIFVHQKEIGNSTCHTVSGPMPLNCFISLFLLSSKWCQQQKLIPFRWNACFLATEFVCGFYFSFACNSTNKLIQHTFLYMNAFVMFILSFFLSSFILKHEKNTIRLNEIRIVNVAFNSHFGSEMETHFDTHVESVT